MEQVKIFSSGGKNESGKVFEGLQNEVNQWLSGNQGMEIISRQTSTTGGGTSDDAWVNCTVLVFYQERKIVP